MYTILKNIHVHESCATASEDELEEPVENKATFKTHSTRHERFMSRALVPNSPRARPRMKVGGSDGTFRHQDSGKISEEWENDEHVTTKG